MIRSFGSETRDSVSLYLIPALLYNQIYKWMNINLSGALRQALTLSIRYPCTQTWTRTYPSEIQIQQCQLQINTFLKFQMSFAKTEIPKRQASLNSRKMSIKLVRRLYNFGSHSLRIAEDKAVDAYGQYSKAQATIAANQETIKTVYNIVASDAVKQTATDLLAPAKKLVEALDTLGNIHPFLKGEYLHIGDPSRYKFSQLQQRSSMSWSLWN